MKIRYKIAIFLLAVFLSLFGLNLIASPSLCLLQIGKAAGNEIISNYLDAPGADIPEYCYIGGGK